MMTKPQGLLVSSCLLVLIVQSIWAQTTAFTYQGKLTDAGQPANGVYDLQFRLFDALVSGNQVGSTVAREDVSVSQGIFTVSLDFGAAAFPGANRFLEISVRPGASTGAFTPLTPLQPINATPYAIKSLNATVADGLSASCVNCVTSTQIGSLPAASGNYIQNSATQQANSNFNISGNGTAAGELKGNSVHAVTLYKLNGDTILQAPGFNNLFVGFDAGTANTTGNENSFLGRFAGRLNTTGSYNAFFGSGAGAVNTTGSGNAFFGAFAGNANTTAGQNAFFGYQAGSRNTTGGGNSFFGSIAGYLTTTGYNNAFFGREAGYFNTTGYENSFFGNRAGYNTTSYQNSFFGALAGQSNTTGKYNSFFGYQAGITNLSGDGNSFFGHAVGSQNTTGASNSFFGYHAGNTNTTGQYNTMLGYFADVGAANLTNATAVGAHAKVTASNSLVLGSINGVNGAIANTNVGIGTTAPSAKLDVVGDGYIRSDLTIGGIDGRTYNPNVRLHVDGPPATDTVETSQILQLTRPVVSGVKNTNSAGLSVGSFETGILGRTRLDIKLSGLPTDSNVYGRIPDVTVMSLLSNGNVGIGTTAPDARLHIANATGSGAGLFVVASEGDRAAVNYSGDVGVVFDSFRPSDSRRLPVLLQPNGGNVGIGTNIPQQQLHVQGNILGSQFMNPTQHIGGAYSQPACWTSGAAPYRLGICNTSSLRYKTEVQSFRGGLDLITRLRPIAFTWNESGLRDIGLGAEEVAQVEPLLTFHNAKGEVEGVRYNQLSAVFINAFKEQHAQLKQQQAETEHLQQQVRQQQELLKQQQTQIEAIKKLLCQQQPNAALCR